MDLSGNIPRLLGTNAISSALGRLCVALYLILGVITISPLLWVLTPPLADYTNHLAHMRILSTGCSESQKI